MKQTIIKKLSVFSNENPTLLGSIATNKQIENAQKILRVTMNEDYKEFILNFGGSYAGMAKTPFCKAIMLVNTHLLRNSKDQENTFCTTKPTVL